jgi:hypothetical protein
MSRAPRISKNPGFSSLTSAKGGGLGLFFKVERRGLCAGARIGVYEGRCNKNRDDYAAALVRFAASDYVLSDKTHRFVVDGQHNDVISGPSTTLTIPRCNS